WPTSKQLCRVFDFCFLRYVYGSSSTLLAFCTSADFTCRSTPEENASSGLKPPTSSALIFDCMRSCLSRFSAISASRRFWKVLIVTHIGSGEFRSFRCFDFIVLLLKEPWLVFSNYSIAPFARVYLEAQIVEIFKLYS